MSARPPEMKTLLCVSDWSCHKGSLPLVGVFRRLKTHLLGVLGPWKDTRTYWHNPGQSKAELSTRSRITIGKLPPHHTTTTPHHHTCVFTIQSYSSYSILCQLYCTTSYEVTSYTWMLPDHSWWNSIPFLCKTKLWESKIDDFRRVISFIYASKSLTFASKLFL